MAANGLNRRQLAFIDAYVGRVPGVQKFNATAAARHAGYSDPEQSGYQNKQNVEVTARISDILSANLLSPQETLAELKDVAGADWRDFIQVKTNPKTGEVMEVKMDLGAKVKALEIVAKAHGLLTDKIDLNANVTAAVELVGVDPDEV